MTQRLGCESATTRNPYTVPRARLFVMLFLAALSTTLLAADDDVKPSNWINHPKIKEIRSIYNQINKSIPNLNQRFFSVSPGAHPNVDWLEDKFGRVRKVSIIIGDEGGHSHSEYYFDEKQILRFALYEFGSAQDDGTHSSDTIRYYFDETGSLFFCDTPGELLSAKKGRSILRMQNLQELRAGVKEYYPHEVFLGDLGKNVDPKSYDVAVSLLKDASQANIERAIPSLVRGLQNNNAEIRASSAYGLGTVAKFAKGALPDLLHSSQDADREVRRCAINAINLIHAEGAILNNSQRK